MITIDDFKRLELKAAKIISASPISGSEKLLELKVSLGDEERQIVAGIAKSYSRESLIGREIIVLANLEPKKLAGRESQGMLLAIDNDGTTTLIVPEKDVPLGTSVS